MTAQIIPFPNRKGTSAETVGAVLSDAFEVPSRDAELAMLVTMADQLLSSYDDSAVDSFLDRVADWEAENQRG